MEIDLSSLSENQKKFYVELLAQSNLQFTKKNNQFVAQFKVDSSQVGSSMHQHLLSDGKSQVSSKSNHSKNDKREPQKIMNRKKLSRVVKIGDLGKF